MVQNFVFCGKIGRHKNKNHEILSLSSANYALLVGVVLPER